MMFLKNFSPVLKYLTRCYPHSNPATTIREQTRVHVLPAGRNNYMFILADNETSDAVVVDPVDIKQVATICERLALNLRCVLTTHHLLDHAGGNRAAATMFPNIPICGGDERVQNITKIVGNNEVIKYGPLNIKCILNPEESSGHVIYVVTNDLDKNFVSAFVGDAFQVAGFGNFPESHKKHIYRILKEIKKFPDNTEIYSGEETAVQNLLLAKAIERHNPAIQQKLKWAMIKRNNKDPTVPTYLHEEKNYNPFLRIDEPSIQRYFGTRTPLETLVKLQKRIRHWLSEQ